jgi:hypothetical protein
MVAITQITVERGEAYLPLASRLLRSTPSST